MNQKDVSEEIIKTKAFLKEKGRNEHSSNELKVLLNLENFIINNNSLPDALIIDTVYYELFKDESLPFFQKIKNLNIIVVERQGKTIFELKKYN